MLSSAPLNNVADEQVRCALPLCMHALRASESELLQAARSVVSHQPMGPCVA
jgi:hypothetical protein